MFEEASFREIKRSPWRHRFRKAPFSKCFPCARKRKASVFKFLQVEERFSRSFFSRRRGGMGDIKSIRRKKNSITACSDFFGIASTLPYVSLKLPVNQDWTHWTKIFAVRNSCFKACVELPDKIFEVLLRDVETWSGTLTKLSTYYFPITAAVLLPSPQNLMGRASN